MVAPPVSVCIPVYNARRYIGEAVASILSQTHGDLELVVVDNCSTDGSWETLQSIRDSRMRVLRNERNLGAAVNWTRAMNECGGEYVKLVCADDVLYPQAIADQYAAIRSADKGVVAVCGLRDIIDENGRTILTGRGIRRPAGLMDGRDLIRRMVRSGRNLLGEPLTCLFRGSAAQLAGPFDDELPYCLDMDFYYRVLCQGRVLVAPRPVGAFRVSRISWSLALARSQARQDRRFFAGLYHSQAAPITAVDLICGSVRCTVDAYLRRMFYAYLRLRRRPHTPST